MNEWILHRARPRNVRKKEGRPLGRPSQTFTQKVLTGEALLLLLLLLARLRERRRLGRAVVERRGLGVIPPLVPRALGGDVERVHRLLLAARQRLLLLLADDLVDRRVEMRDRRTRRHRDLNYEGVALQ